MRGVGLQSRLRFPLLAMKPRLQVLAPCRAPLDQSAIALLYWFLRSARLPERVPGPKLGRPGAATSAFAPLLPLGRIALLIYR